ncbi:MAG: hypothetical protein CL908_08800 [Deltaproteobacteria bacterium]|nr:hypothetical protein [Deltaproteobacteria bacterium]
MIVHIHTDASITLDDADTFTAFSVSAPDLHLEQILAAFGPDAKAGEDDHVWIAISRLHALGEAHGGADWREGCDGMIAFATGKGWVDEDRQLVRAHVEG